MMSIERKRRITKLMSLLPKAAQLTTKLAAVTVAAACLKGLATQVLDGYCHHLRVTHHYRGLIHLYMKRKQHMHRGKVTLLLSSARISMVKYGNMTQMRASIEDSRYKYRICLCNLARDPSLAWLAGAGTIASGSTGRHSGTFGWRRNYAGFQVRGGWWSSGGYLIYSSCMPGVVCNGAYGVSERGLLWSFRILATLGARSWLVGGRGRTCGCCSEPRL